MPALPPLLRRRQYRLLLASQAAGGLGGWMATVGLIALVAELTGSATAVGGVLVLRLLPGAVAWPLAVRTARRWERRRTMLSMDLARAGMIALVPLIGALWWVYLWAFLVEVASLVFLPARDATVPELVERSELPLGNGLMLASSYGTIPLGALAFTGVAALSLPEVGPLARPFALVFWLNALAFVVSFLLIRRLTVGRGRAEAEGGLEGGLFAALRIPLVRATLPAAVAASLGLGALFSLGIVFVRDVLGASDQHFGLLVLVFGIGASLGVGLLYRRRAPTELRDIRIGVASMGVLIMVFTAAPQVGWVLLGTAGFGAAAAATVVAGMSILQDRLGSEGRGLAFTAFHITVRMTLGLAALGAGAAGDLLGEVTWPLLGPQPPARTVLLFAGLLVALSSAAVPTREPD